MDAARYIHDISEASRFQKFGHPHGPHAVVALHSRVVNPSNTSTTQINKKSHTRQNMVLFPSSFSETTGPHLADSLNGSSTTSMPFNIAMSSSYFSRTSTTYTTVTIHKKNHTQIGKIYLVFFSWFRLDGGHEFRGGYRAHTATGLLGGHSLHYGTYAEHTAVHPSLY